MWSLNYQRTQTDNPQNLRLCSCQQMINKMRQKFPQQTNQLLQSNQTLQNQVTQLVNHISSLQIPAAPSAPPLRKSPVSMPEKFSGQMDMFPAFLGQCQLFMSLRPEDFPNDRAKVGFIISLLSGQAAKWATPLLTQDSPLLDNFQGFLQQMRVMFENPIKSQTVARQFHLLCMDSNWNEPAHMDAFQEGLVDTLKDELVHAEQASTLDALVIQCLHIEARLQQRRSRRPIVEPPSLFCSQAMVKTEEPMELGALCPRLMAQERSRRFQEGLCLYCGGPGHVANSCKWRGTRRPVPETTPGSSGKQGRPDLKETLGRARSTPPPQIAEVFLQSRSEEIPVVALVDLGAMTNFMDRAFATHFDIPLVEVEPPIKVETIDGRELWAGHIRFATQPLCLVIGDHEEAISFYITSDLHLPLVLGMAWLRLHDPQVAWAQNTISFPSLQYVDHLRHTCAGQDITAPAISVPPELSDFSDVFSEKEVDRPYDCPEDLLPNAPLLKGRLYSMSEPELAALCDFLDKNLGQGFIQQSSSPLSVPVLFVKKKTGDLHLCCDYRRLNAITMKNSYPLPLIPELMEHILIPIVRLWSRRMHPTWPLGWCYYKPQRMAHLFFHAHIIYRNSLLLSTIIQFGKKSCWPSRLRLRPGNITLRGLGIRWRFGRIIVIGST
uniref:CCHC-type domain-containing protein n=1 Tax=Pseudonaja textilis TaxID=8673 RepID=A0A670ZVZ6_PSETE